MISRLWMSFMFQFLKEFASSLLLRLEGTLIELEMRFKVDRITLRLNIDDADL
jgi:hypothetical protein